MILAMADQTGGLPEPFDVDAAVRRARERALHTIGRLPPMSPVLNKLMVSLADDDITFAKLGDLIEKDTVLAGNVLRLVNSAFYARRGEVNSVRHAVSILGLAKIRNVAISLSINHMWKNQKWPEGWSARQFNLHATACAVMSDLMALEFPVDYAEGAFTAGLLQNLGILPIALGFGEEYRRIREVYEAGQADLISCERQITGLDHAELSAEVLRHWKLPEPIVAAVACHHNGWPIQTAPSSLGQVVALTDRLVGQHGIQAQEWHRAAEGTALETLEGLGFGERAPAAMQVFESEYEALKAFFQ